MAEAGKTEDKEASGEDPSMEDILHSIKSIIAEDETDDSEKPVEASTDNEEVQGSDVLELTEALPEEEAKPAAEEVKEEAHKETEPEAEESNDVLNKIDEALAVEKEEEPSAPPEASAANNEDVDTLLSDHAIDEASSSVKKLQNAAEPPLPEVNTTPSPDFLSGNSVEAMAMNMLKPMMKEWLDENLPSIVERIVTVEIRKLTK